MTALQAVLAHLAGRISTDEALRWIEAERDNPVGVDIIGVLRAGGSVRIWP